MRKYISLFFLIPIFLMGCDNMPSGIIKPQQMVALLTDIHTADGALMNTMQQPDSLYKYGTGNYLAVFKKFHTDSTQFKRSYKYYTVHPVELATIYDSVMKRMKFKVDSLSHLVTKQNKANARNFLSTAAPGNGSGGYAPGQVPGSHPLPVNPAMYNNPAAMQRAKAMRDSMRKKQLKLKNALPKQQH